MIIIDYFSHRTLWYEIDPEVPQGSVLRPLLWNIMYDGIFKIQFLQEVIIVDDVAVLVQARHLENYVQTKQ